MGMFKIKIVALPGCSLCADLMDRLKDRNIPFDIAHANEHESLCDMLEVLLQTTTYPIVVFETPQRVYFISMPNAADRLKWTALDDTSTAIGVADVNGIYDTIDEFLKK